MILIDNQATISQKNLTSTKLHSIKIILTRVILNISLFYTPHAFRNLVSKMNFQHFFKHYSTIVVFLLPTKDDELMLRVGFLSLMVY